MTLRDEHKQFRTLEVVPGIGKKAQEALNEFGFVTFGHLVGQFLLFSWDVELMTAWFNEKVPGHPKHYVEAAVTSIHRWCETNL